MKKLILAAVSMLLALTAAAQPLLVGHRGSGYGVENTEEAFRTGASLGYQYLETDIKVTKDTRFILTHDDDVSRFNSSGLTIAGSTLAELQALELTQTRNSVKYTGKFMCLEEFLDLCTELNVKPVIELKWATGVNSNDQSNMSKLMQVIFDKGYRNKCVILTSMKNCLTWIRTRYADVELQFLCNSLSDANLEWCATNNIDVDIRNDGCSAAIVEAVHAKGLLANMWTTNTNDGYATYGNMGFDFITTDRLDGHNLPELNLSTELPDPTVSEEITFNPVYTDKLVAELSGKTIRRAIEYNGNVYVLALDSNNEPTIVVYDIATGDVVANVSTTGMSVGAATKGDATRFLKCSDIQISEDGYLLASNLTETIDADANYHVIIYKWENDANGIPTGNPAEWIKSQAAGWWYNSYTGSTFAYLGTSTSGAVYVSAETTGSSGQVRVSRILVENGVADGTVFNDRTYPEVNAIRTTRATLGDDYRFTASPLNEGSFFITGSGAECTLAEFPYVCTDASCVSVPNDITTNLAPNNINGIAFFAHGEKTYAALPATEKSGVNSGVKMIDVTPGISSATAVTTIGTTLDANSEPTAAVGHSVVDGENTHIGLAIVRSSGISYFSTNTNESGVGNVELDDTMPVQMYNLQGIRVSSDNLTPGIYIQVQGSKSKKVYIR